MNNRNDNYFSLPFHAGKYENERIQFLITKCFQKSKSISFLNFTFLFRSTAKTYFSFSFYTEKVKNTNAVFGYKRVQNAKAISLLKTLDVNYM